MGLMFYNTNYGSQVYFITYKVTVLFTTYDDNRVKHI
jgi:hypothetical protein